MTEERKQKQVNVRMLRDRAIARLRRDGRNGGNYMLNGLLFRVWELDTWPWIMEMTVPRYPDKFDYPPLSSRITVRFKGEPVLKVVFDDERSRLGRYVPGAWERLI